MSIDVSFALGAALAAEGSIDDADAAGLVVVDTRRSADVGARGCIEFAADGTFGLALEVEGRSCLIVSPDALVSDGLLLAPSAPCFIPSVEGRDPRGAVLALG